MKNRYNRHKVSYQRKLLYFRRRRDEARDLFMLALMEYGKTLNVAKTIEKCEEIVSEKR